MRGQVSTVLNGTRHRSANSLAWHSAITSVTRVNEKEESTFISSCPVCLAACPFRSVQDQGGRKWFAHLLDNRSHKRMQPQRQVSRSLFNNCDTMRYCNVRFALTNWFWLWTIWRFLKTRLRWLVNSLPTIFYSMQQAVTPQMSKWTRASFFTNDLCSLFRIIIQYKEAQNCIIIPIPRRRNFILTTKFCN